NALRSNGLNPGSADGFCSGRHSFLRTMNASTSPSIFPESVFRIRSSCRDQPLASQAVEQIKKRSGCGLERAEPAYTALRHVVHTFQRAAQVAARIPPRDKLFQIPLRKSVLRSKLLPTLRGIVHSRLQRKRSACRRPLPLHTEIRG